MSKNINKKTKNNSNKKPLNIQKIMAVIMLIAIMVSFVASIIAGMNLI